MEKDFVVSELLGQGVAYTVMGICIVFLILIIIMFVIKAMALFSAEKAPAPEPAPAAPEAAEVESAADEGELVAVITAAVAACMGADASSIVVKSYKKAASWNRAGRREAIENRF